MFRNVPATAGQVTFVLTLTGDNEPMVLTCGIAVSEGAAQAVAESIADSLNTSNALRAVISSLYKFTSIEVAINRGTAAEPDYEVGVVSVNISGSNGAAALPQNSAWILRKFTSLGGRRGKGRMFVPGLAEAVVSATGQVQDDFLDDLQAAATFFYGLLSFIDGDVQCVPVLIHSAEVLANAPAPTIINSFGVDPIIGTQRRRLRK